MSFSMSEQALQIVAFLCEFINVTLFALER